MKVALDRVAFVFCCLAAGLFTLSILSVSEQIARADFGPTCAIQCAGLGPLDPCWEGCCNMNCSAKYSDPNAEKACATDCMNNVVPSFCDSGTQMQDYCNGGAYTCYLNIVTGNTCVLASPPCSVDFLCKGCNCNPQLNVGGSYTCWCH